MEQALPVAVLAGLLAAGGAAWVLARRYGALAGLALPALAAGLALWSTNRPVGHAEELMGRGLVELFLWLPLVVLTLAGAGLGLIARRKARRAGRD
jgi:hypothetical protein